MRSPVEHRDELVATSLSTLREQDALDLDDLIRAVMLDAPRWRGSSASTWGPTARARFCGASSASSRRPSTSKRDDVVGDVGTIRRT